MKLNRSFFVKTALTITLLTSATLSANAKEVNNYGAEQKKSSDTSKVSQIENIDFHSNSLSEDEHLSILKIEAKDRESESHGEVTAALIADSDGENHVAEISDQRFNSKQTIEKEFAFAILIFVVGLGYFYKTLNHA